MSKRNMISLLALLALLITSFFLQQHSTQKEKKILINEICSNNFSIGNENSNGYFDYIELYNPGESKVLLDGYYLSDDRDDLYKYSLEGLEINPKDFFILHPNFPINENSSSQPFGISRQGEMIYLTIKTEEKEFYDYVYIPNLSYNTSYGRSMDGQNHWQIMTPTPGESNHKAVALPSQELSPPAFSVASGFYEDSILLKLKAKFGETIYYTLDGSIPTKNSLKYQSPIEISDACSQENLLSARTDLCPYSDYTPEHTVDKAAVVRAVAYDEAQNKISSVATEVYFIGYENRSEYKNLPIISLVTDPSALFDHETGIYTNGITLENYNRECIKYLGQTASEYTDENGTSHYRYEASNAFQEGKQWEREATVTYFDKNHKYSFKQNVGIRIAGASSRSTPQKSFNLYGRDIYDTTTTFPYNFFDGFPTSTIKLRNGGSLNSDIKITDAFLENLVEDRNVSIQRSTPSILFLNGEYWGIYNIRQRYNEEYISTYYDIAEDNIWMIDDTYVKIGTEETQQAYNDYIYMAAECDLSDDEIYTMVSNYIDIQSFIDFCCINIYTSNTDLSEGHNIALWRSAANDTGIYGDSKWRWMLFDLDQTLQLPTADTTPQSWLENTALMNDPIVKNYLRNEEFKKQFCITFIDIANVNFNSSRIKKELTKWKKVYKEQLLADHRRFFEDPLTESMLEEKFSNIETYFNHHFEFSMKALQDTFQLEGTLLPVTIDVNIPEAGSIQLNTSTLKNITTFHGQYLSDFPLQITAFENDGYRFVGWTGDFSSDEKHMELSLKEKGIRLQAIYEKIE